MAVEKVGKEHRKSKMPLTEFQKQVLRLLASNRSPDSHIAGGTALNASPASARFSLDIDIFHDAQELVESSARLDAETLESQGYSMRWLTVNPYFFRAVITRGDQQLKLEWAVDSAYRFFPVIQDPDMGWRLHNADLATNKALALGGRSETRDLLDIVMVDGSFLPLHAVVWAACGKDPGFTPVFLLEQMARNARIDPLVLRHIAAWHISPTDLKRKWLEIHDRALAQVEAFSRETPGCFYVDARGSLFWPEDPTQTRRHEPFLGGSWPKVIGDEGSQGL